MSRKRIFLDEIIQTPISGKRPAGGGDSNSEGIPSIGGENIKKEGGMDYSTLKMVPLQFFLTMGKGKVDELDVLINKDGALTGKVGLYTAEFYKACVNEHVFILRTKSIDILDQIFLYYSISSKTTQKSIKSRITGSAQPGLNSSFTKHVSIFLPEIKHQQKIATILTTIDTAIEKTQELIDKYKKIKTGLMNDLFTRGIGADGILRPPRSEAPELYKKTELGWIPKEWAVVELGTCGDVFNGSTPSRQNTSFWGGEVPWLSSGRINDYIINSPSEYVTKKALDNTPIKLVPKKSVLVGLIGQGRTRGMVAKLSIESTINQNLAAIVPFEGVSGDYIHQYLFKEYQRLRNVGRGSNQGALNCQIVREFDIAIPKQNNEQEIISKALLVLDEKIHNENRIIVKLQKQKAGLMQDLLTGKVEVTVPDEEVVNA